MNDKEPSNDELAIRLIDRNLKKLHYQKTDLTDAEKLKCFREAVKASDRQFEYKLQELLLNALDAKGVESNEVEEEHA